MKINHYRSRGFLVMDTLFATLGMVVLLMIVSVAVVKQQKTTRDLAASRTALRAAEDGIARLQARQSLPADVQTLDLSDAAPAGQKWVEVSAVRSGHRVALVGLVPAGGDR